MYCARCGKELRDDSVFCSNCGAAIGGAGNGVTPNGVTPNGVTGNWVTPNGMMQNGVTAPQTNQTMKWYKFIIYFQLFANAVINLVNAGLLFSGIQYQGYRDDIYAFYPGIKASDYIFGFLYIVLVVGSIITRQMLVKYRKTGPMFYYGVMGANAGILILYMIVTSVLVGQTLVSSNTVVNVIVLGLLIGYNVKYFNDRKDLFIN